MFWKGLANKEDTWSLEVCDDSLAVVLRTYTIKSDTIKMQTARACISQALVITQALVIYYIDLQQKVFSTMKQKHLRQKYTTQYHVLLGIFSIS